MKMYAVVLLHPYQLEWCTTMVITTKKEWKYMKIIVLPHLGLPTNLPGQRNCVKLWKIFAGLRITATGIAPSAKLLSSIRDFPTPKDITSARSWFGFVNQVAWAYSISSITEPFRALVKRNSKFYWDATLDQLFQDSKHLISARMAFVHLITNILPTYRLIGVKMV